MKIKSFIFAVTVGLGLASAAQANDISVDLGSVGAPKALSQVISHSIGTFTDKWTFDIPYTLSSGGSVSNLAISLSGWGTLYNIDNLSVQLYGANNALISDLDTNAGSSSQIKVGSGVFPAADNYYFKVSGKADGSFGGQYVFAVNTLPVPEPETYAMLLAGLGILGAAARRRM
jgi:hypothetical protein